MCAIEIPSSVWGPCKQLKFTEREIHAAVLLSRGLSNDQIAKQMSITPWAAARYVSRIVMKLQPRGIGNGGSVRVRAALELTRMWESGK